MKEKRYISVQSNMKIISFTDLDRREKYLAKAKKITNKNGDFTYDSP